MKNNKKLALTGLSVLLVLTAVLLSWGFISKLDIASLFSGDNNNDDNSNVISSTSAVATPVIVVQDEPPLIKVIKTVTPPALNAGQGTVTYTYKVTNPGTTALNNVSVTDDKVSPVTYISGDINNDSLLQSGETWTYTGSAVLTETITNTATAEGSANGLTAADTAVVTVVVTNTDTGGKIPDTATSWYNILLAGFVITLLGVAGIK